MVHHYTSNNKYLIPAKAGIQRKVLHGLQHRLDSSLRRNEVFSITVNFIRRKK